MIHADAPLLEIQIPYRQPEELADAHSRAQKDDDLVQILAEVRIVPDEVEEVLLLLLGKRAALDRVVGNDVEPEFRGIAANDFLRVGHLERWLDDSPNRGDGAEGIPVIEELDQPELGVRYLDGTDLSCTE